MKAYTITVVQLQELLEATSYGAAILLDDNRGGTFPSKEAIAKKLAKAHTDLARIELEG